MKILVTIVAYYGTSDAELGTTWWVDEVSVRRGKSVAETPQDHIRERSAKFTQTTKMKSRILSVCHTILPTTKKK